MWNTADAATEQTRSPGLSDVDGALAGLEIAELQTEVVGPCIYLRGLAPSYRIKHAASERAEELVRGTRVVNEIRVAQRGSTDEDVIRHAAAAIGRVAPGAGRSLTIDARDGILYLSGAVQDAEQRRAIEAAAWDAGGVAHVHSDLRCEATAASDAEISATLDQYVRRAMNLSPGAVTTTYRSGIVTLDGGVSSTARKQAIEDLLRWHDRVIDVVNRLRVGDARPVEAPLKTAS